MRHETRVAAVETGSYREGIHGPAGLREEPGKACRLTPRIRFILLCFALILPIVSGGGAETGPAASAKPAASQLPVLTTAAAVHDLTLSDARRQYPVHLRAVCVVCFPDWHGFFVNDGVSGVYVETRNQKLLTRAIHNGTLLDIEGVTGPGEFAPIVDQSTLRILGEKPLPPAPLVSLDRLSTGAEDGQWIAFEGAVRSATFRDSMVDLIVASGRLQVEVMTEPGGRQVGSLVNARVRVSGGAGPIFNQLGQLTGTNVYAPSLRYIQVLQPGPADPFAVPLSQVRAVFDYTPGTGSDHLVRIRGVVAARWGQTVFIDDGMHGASVLGRELSTLQPGDLVDAVGYPALGDASHTITNAVFRRLGMARLPEAQPITVKDALSGRFEGNLVQMDGQLFEQQRDTGQITFLVSAGGLVFTAVLSDTSGEGSLPGLRDGSRVRLTGICMITETQAMRHYRIPTAFHILLRSPSDVVVTERASWWTPVHTMTLLTFAVTGTVFVLAWVVALRKRVAQQTRLLRESEERFRHLALHDSLTGLATRVLLNDRLELALERNRRNRLGLAMLMVDVDRFKEINDTWGHEVGDEVLRVTAERLTQAVRREDTVARIGGDEFVVLLAGLSEPGVAERIATVLVGALAVPIRVWDREVPVSASVGVCAMVDGEIDGDALLRNADLALYDAKAAGRRCFAISRGAAAATSR